MVTERSDMRAVSTVAPKTASKFQLQNTSLLDEGETALGCQASLLGSVSPLPWGGTGYATRSSEAQDRVMQSRNWHFLLGLSSSDLFTRAKPAGLAPRRESSSGPRAGLVSILLPSGPFAEQRVSCQKACLTYALGAGNPWGSLGLLP